ncbi:16S rRNA (guanine(966)-N(2))-methyltransferase RsmD [Oricola cellulosilytica]|uniref:16S rRNA (Guanine(966)-N(2))-methyltransferase RsmD n=1 Tax=Oricola cellulosilytica TaxID=1429082 RepID=A0A4V2MP81_9HYPH|nr:16S rRNA (guanine(966)-N(2))-methyltransferase RsmD [Oricola cellulosilytica]TCD16642.1 16S rRNA (guanine(966)-N(2))-methyltransferase RsmD [Oricola cellulosilytica]
MRIVGGKFRGRTLASPKAGADAIRPTADRTRESLFNILAHGWPDVLEGARVLDLFAGTGAVGIEALSRGAAMALFIEQSAGGRGLIRANIEAFGLQGVTKLFRRDATRMGDIGTMEPFDLVFADPPYGRGLAERALVSLREGGWLRADALLVVEETSAANFAAPDGFRLADERRFGDTTMHFMTIA